MQYLILMNIILKNKDLNRVINSYINYTIQYFYYCIFEMKLFFTFIFICIKTRLFCSIIITYFLYFILYKWYFYAGLGFCYVTTMYNIEYSMIGSSIFFCKLKLYVYYPIYRFLIKIQFLVEFNTLWIVNQLNI